MREYENCLLDHPSALGNLLWVAYCVLKQLSKAEFQVNRHHTEQVLQGSSEASCLINMLLELSEPTSYAYHYFYQSLHFKNTKLERFIKAVFCQAYYNHIIYNWV